MPRQKSKGATSANRAAEILAEFRANNNLALGHPQDGCYARTHVMVRRLQELGLTPSKIWAFCSDYDEKYTKGVEDFLWVEQLERPEGRVEWYYHVAPALEVRGEDGVVREMVFDPLISDVPVTVEEWLTAVHDTPKLVRTALGEPPIPDEGGSGYWPGADDLKGPDRHAEEKLEEFRAQRRGT